MSMFSQEYSSSTASTSLQVWVRNIRPILYTKIRLSFRSHLQCLHKNSYLVCAVKKVRRLAFWLKKKKWLHKRSRLRRFHRVRTDVVLTNSPKPSFIASQLHHTLIEQYLPLSILVLLGYTLEAKTDRTVATTGAWYLSTSRTRRSTRLDDCFTFSSLSNSTIPQAETLVHHIWGIGQR